MTTRTRPSFSFNPNTTPISENAESNTGDVKPKSPGQITTYMDVCKRKGITPQDLTNVTTFDEMSELIKTAIAYFPASPGQKDMIKKKIASLSEMNVTIAEPDYSTLTGGKEGSASALIQALIKMEDDAKLSAPPTHKQLGWLVNMFLCPDIGFEEYGVNRYIELDEFDEKTGNPLRKVMTEDEFADELEAKMTGKEASSFIEKFSHVHQTWKFSRLTANQKTQIRELEDRIAGTTPIMKSEWKVNAEGVLIQIETPAFPQPAELSPNGFIPLKELQLQQLSKDDAVLYINMLKGELARKEGTPSEPETDDALLRNRQTDELKNLQDLMFKLETVAGYADDELHDAVSSLITEGYDHDEVKKQKAKIREFMHHLLESHAISFNELIELSQESEVAQRILVGVA